MKKSRYSEAQIVSILKEAENGVPITNDLVRRRLKLASVSSDLIQLFRDGEMSLDCIMAFTLTDDHARQNDVWEVVKQNYNPSPHSIRNQLTQTSYSGSSKLALFVGIDAYKQAGGSVPTRGSRRRAPLI